MFWTEQEMIFGKTEQDKGGRGASRGDNQGSMWAGRGDLGELGKEVEKLRWLMEETEMRSKMQGQQKSEWHCCAY